MPFPFKRIFYLFVFLSVLGSLLLGRLVYLQWLNGTELAALGLLGRIQGVKLSALRGDIIDCNGELLTNRETRYSVTVFPKKYMDNEPEALTALAKVLGTETKDLERQLDKQVVPVQLADHLDADTANKVAALQQAGVVIASVKSRYGGGLASHVIGYANRVDNVGLSGIEQAYDDVLKVGNDEYIAALLDARHEIIPGLRYRKLHLPQTGRQKQQSVELTIDRRVQRAAEDVMDARVAKGAAVVLDPWTGDVLAMVSRPNFHAEWVEAYLDHPDAPLMNRAVSSYQPGSIFKLIVAAAALESGLVKEDELFTDRGYIDVDGLIFKGWDQKSGERQITFAQALAYSSNPVFIKIGLELGMDRLVRFAEHSGFGRSTGSGLPDESNGNLPRPEEFFKGELANLSIGQGKCEVTPLQMAGFVASIVQDGKRVVPRLVKQAGETVYELPANAEPLFSAVTAKKLQKMMADVTEYGTGQAAFVTDGGSAGKTGSAETGRMSKDGKSISHAWFAGFAPLEKPRYVVIVFIEGGMSGGGVAAPVFKEIVERIESIPMHSNENFLLGTK